MHTFRRRYRYIAHHRNSRLHPACRHHRKPGLTRRFPEQWLYPRIPPAPVPGPKPFQCHTPHPQQTYFHSAIPRYMPACLQQPALQVPALVPVLSKTVFLLAFEQPQALPQPVLPEQSHQLPVRPALAQSALVPSFTEDEGRGRGPQALQ